MEDKKHILFKPDYKRFDAGEESQIQNFENRGKQIHDLDTGMSPFMKNQNDHMQRMKNSVARQEAIASQYENGGALNSFAQSEQQKDDRIATMLAKNE